MISVTLTICLIVNIYTFEETLRILNIVIIVLSPGIYLVVVT